MWNKLKDLYQNHVDKKLLYIGLLIAFVFILSAKFSSCTGCSSTKPVSTTINNVSRSDSSTFINQIDSLRQLIRERDIRIAALVPAGEIENAQLKPIGTQYVYIHEHDSTKVIRVEVPANYPLVNFNGLVIPRSDGGFYKLFGVINCTTHESYDVKIEASPVYIDTTLRDTLTEHIKKLTEIINSSKFESHDTTTIVYEKFPKSVSVGYDPLLTDILQINGTIRWRLSKNLEIDFSPSLNFKITSITLKDALQTTLKVAYHF